MTSASHREAHANRRALHPLLEAALKGPGRRPHVQRHDPCMFGNPAPKTFRRGICEPSCTTATGAMTCASQKSKRSQTWANFESSTQRIWHVTAMEATGAGWNVK